jgi:hypothetical protein
MRVFVYFNLHKRCYSIKALEGENKGRVIHHASRVMLAECGFKVSEAGRQRVLATKRKNVHAGVVGRLVGHVPHTCAMPEIEIDDDATQVTYNPYKYTSFVVKDDPRLQVIEAGRVLLNEHGMFARGCKFYVPEFDMTKEG